MSEGKKMGVGVGVMILREGKILLGKRHEDLAKSASVLHGENTWTMPGGKLDFGELFEDAAAREVLEETSIKIVKDKLKLISLANDQIPGVQFVTIGFLCEDFEGEAKAMEPNKITEWQWFDVDNLPNNLYSPSAKVVYNYLNKTIYQS